MKGFYILALIVIVLAGLVYMALKDTDSDLRRRHEFLVSSLDAMDERLKAVLDPLKRLRAEKSTIRLDKEFGQLDNLVRQSRRKLNAALHSVETLQENTRKVTSESLEKLRQEQDVLFVQIDHFTARVKVIDAFFAEMKPLRTNVVRLLQEIQLSAAEGGGAGTALPEEMRDRVDKVAESTQATVKLADETLTWIWNDLEQGKIYAERRISDLKTCIPTLETLLKDLESR